MMDWRRSAEQACSSPSAALPIHWRPARWKRKSEGLVYGIGSGMFRLAGTVLTYGVVSAVIFGAIRYLLFGGAL